MKIIKIEKESKRFCINSTLKTLLLLRDAVNGVAEITTQKYKRGVINLEYFKKINLPITPYNIAVLVTTDNEIFGLRYERISDDGFIKVTLYTTDHTFYNIISPFGNLLNPTWFHWCCVFKKDENFVKVQRAEDKKYNWIKKDGSFLSSTWFDYCDSFHNGFARVELGENRNFIDYKGKLLSQEWFKDCGDFNKGCEFALVKRADVKNHLNLITKEGKLVSKRWFSRIDRRSSDGFYLIQDSNDFWNIVDSKGNLLREKWFRRNIFSVAWALILLRKELLIRRLKK